MLKTCQYLTKGTGASLLLEMGGSPGKKKQGELSFIIFLFYHENQVSPLRAELLHLLEQGVLGVVTAIPPSRTPEETGAILDNQPGVKNYSLGGKRKLLWRKPPTVGKQTVTGGWEGIRAPAALPQPVPNALGLCTSVGMAGHMDTSIIPLRTTSQGGIALSQWETIVPKPHIQTEVKLQATSMKIL